MLTLFNVLLEMVVHSKFFFVFFVFEFCFLIFFVFFSSQLKFIEPVTFKITQTWDSSQELNNFLKDNIYSDYIKSTVDLKASEDVSISKLS